MERDSRTIATGEDKFKDNSITLRVDSWRKRERSGGGRIKRHKRRAVSSYNTGEKDRSVEELGRKDGEKDERLCTRLRKYQGQNVVIWGTDGTASQRCKRGKI